MPSFKHYFNVFVTSERSIDVQKTFLHHYLKAKIIFSNRNVWKHDWSYQLVELSAMLTWFLLPNTWSQRTLQEMHSRFLVHQCVNRNQPRTTSVRHKMPERLVLSARNARACEMSERNLSTIFTKDRTR